MARIRTLKPEFWSHPVMGRLDDCAKSMAIALLNFSDDEGYFIADPILVRNFARPFDEDSSSTRRALDDLSRSGWIEVVEHPSHGSIGRVVNFKDHQKIDRPSPSKIKAYFDSSSPRRMLVEPSLLEQGTGNREKEQVTTPISPLVPDLELQPEPAPPRQAPKGKFKKGRRTIPMILEGYGDKTRMVVNAACAEWRSEDPEDGRPIRRDVPELSDRVDEILRDNPNLAPETLIEAFRIYLSQPRKRYKAPQFFFGPGDSANPEPWAPYVRMVTHKAIQQAQAQQVPA